MKKYTTACTGFAFCDSVFVNDIRVSISDFDVSHFMIFRFL